MNDHYINIPILQINLNYQFLMDNNLSTGFARQLINCVSYNSDNTCLAIATNKGYKIFTTQPFALKRNIDFGAPIQIIQMINRSNLLALVGFKETPFAPPNKLVIFDDNTQKIIADMSFKSSVKSVLIRQGKIVVAVCNKVFVIGLFSMQVQHVIGTFKFEQDQKYNIISLSNDPSNLILAAPGLENGQVLLVYFQRETQRKIKAHQSILSAVQLSRDGQKLATTSQKGIQIRIFNTRTGDNLQEVRRGNQFATIYSLVFSKNAEWLAVSSDSQNIHIFAIKYTQNEKQKKYEKGAESIKQNPKSMLYFIKGVFPYFDAQYSYSNYKIQDYQTQMECYLGFNFRDNTLMMANNFGTLQKLEMNEKGGKCKLLSKESLI